MTTTPDVEQQWSGFPPRWSPDWESRLTAIESRVANATPGPWSSDLDAVPFDPENPKHYFDFGPGNPRRINPFIEQGAGVYSNGNLAYEVVQGGAQDEQGGAVGILANADADFIAHAREDVEQLAEEVRHMDRAIKGYQREGHEVEQYLGKALGYPEGYPIVSEVDDGTVIVAPHTPGTIAQEAAERIEELERQLDLGTYLSRRRGDSTQCERHYGKLHPGCVWCLRHEIAVLESVVEAANNNVDRWRERALAAGFQPAYERD